jgi:hypothetical protein
LRTERAEAEIHDNLNKKPDLYAAAICIKVRSDHLVAGLQLVLRSGGLPYRPETLTKRAECLVRQIYFFFLAVFFFATFFAFFAFLAMSPSQNKLVQRTRAVENRRARDQEYMTIVKLILCCSILCRCERFDQIEPLLEGRRAGTHNCLLAIHPECLSILI